MGVIGSDYALMQSKDPTDMDIFSGTGGSHAILANRLSYVLNLNGPSLALDTACSSSLVTVHLACQSLRRRESDLALAGGVNLILSPEMTLALTKAHMMAPDGRCKTFDASADGYVRGEGCGMVVLKRLSDAMAAGDRILAVIRGSAVNHDGRSNGLSAPNGPAQEAVIRAALADAGLAPADIELRRSPRHRHAAGRSRSKSRPSAPCWATGRSPDRPLVVGSVKTNIGHLESAAGIAGLIKVVLMLRHGQIPPHLHLKTVNPLLKLEDSPLEIPDQRCAIGRGGRSRGGRASAPSDSAEPTPTSFSKSRRAGAASRSPLERPRHLLALSARSPQALSELAGRYADYRGGQPVGLAGRRRLHGQHGARAFRPSRGRGRRHRSTELRDNLRAFAADPPAAGVHQRPGRARSAAADRFSLHRPGGPVRRHGPRAVRDPADVPRSDRSLRRAAAAAAGPPACCRCSIRKRARCWTRPATRNR